MFCVPCDNVRALASLFSQKTKKKRNTLKNDCLLFYLWFLWVFVALCGLWVFVALCGLSPVAESKGYSLVAVHGLLIGMASLVAEQRL